MIKPMLCRLGTEAELATLSGNPDWIFEPKLDGFRVIADIKPGDTHLWARSGSEKTHLFKDLKIQTVKDTPIVVDGEVLSGKSFQDLQSRVNRINGIAETAKEFPARYSVFDILEVNGISVRGFPLVKRKELLKSLLVPTENVSLTASATDGVSLFALMKQNQLEGVVGKNLKGTYQENSRADWLKVKTWQEAMFVAVGYTAGTGWRASTFGALVLADTKGNYVGAVGTGFNDADIKSIYGLFRSTGVCPFPRAPEPATWIKPFPVKVQYLEYTNDGILRFPSFKGVING